MTRTPPIASFFVAIVCFALFATSLGSACSHASRKDTLKTSLVSVNAARDGFLSWDRHHQQTIVDQATSREEATTKVAEYRESQSKVIAGFLVAYESLANAATRSDEPSLATALRVSADVVTLVDKIVGGGQ